MTVRIGIPARPSVVTVDAATLTGATINQRLLGGLHPFGWAGPPSAAAKAHAAGVINVNRTDKLLSVTPIKAGGVDGTHPTLGLSGAWSYDWQVVDRTIADIAAQGAGMELYLSLDSTPQILGGDVAPYSGTNLSGTNPATGGLAGYASFGANIPNDLAAFGAMCVDLIAHIRSLGTVTIAYCGVGNEPDGGLEFWRDPATGLSATSPQYHTYYKAIYDAVKAYDATIKVGGPELVNPVANFTTWLRPFMVYGQANACQPDFVSFHDYAQNGWVLNQVCAKIDKAKADLSWVGTLELICGEWNMGPGPVPPFRQAGTFTELGDYAAGACARELMELQRLGFVRAIYFKNARNLTGAAAVGDFSGGAFNDLGPWTPGNVMRLWARMGAVAVVSHTIDADPGVQALTAKTTGTGKLWVLLASAHYRRTPAIDVTINLPGIASGRVTTLTMIDREHSNQYEAGLANAELQTVPVADVAAEQVRLTLPARCACLLEIAP
jgi:hypothetical protein